MSFGDYGALWPCLMLQCPFLPWTGVGRCPSPAHTWVRSHLRVTSLLYKCFFLSLHHTPASICLTICIVSSAIFTKEPVSL